MADFPYILPTWLAKRLAKSHALLDLLDVESGFLLLTRSGGAWVDARFFSRLAAWSREQIHEALIVKQNYLVKVKAT